MDEALTAQAHQAMPFAATLGLEVTSGTAEEVVGRAEWTPDRCTAGGVLHGGYLAALADSVGALCAVLNLPDGATGTITIEAKTNFLRPVTSGWIHLRATPIHAGRTTIVIQTDITDDDGKLVTTTIQTQAVLS